jgi:hypothetical protein
MSYTLNDGDRLCRLFDELDSHLGFRAKHVALNLDVGHAWLVCSGSPALRALLWDGFLSRVAHGHISRHVPVAHFADLPLDVSTLEELKPWVDLFAASQRGEDACRFRTGSLAVELEGSVPPSAAVTSYVTLQEWLETD